MKTPLKYILPLCLTALTFAAHGQTTIEQWREVMRKYQEENRIIDDLLKNANKERQITENELKITLTRIDNSRKIVTSLDRQIEERNRRAGLMNATINRLEVDQKKLRTEYADMVRAAYNNYKLNNFLLFLFASDDFNEATKRIYFMRRYNRHREEKTTQIKNVTDSLAVVVDELKNELAELDKTKQTRNSELAILRKTEKEHRIAADDLKKRQRTLSDEKKAKEKLIAAAQQKISELVAAEAKKAKGEVLSNEQQEYMTKLTGRFDQNQGKLPYPAKNGVIIESFGASQAGSMNKGIKIATSPGRQVDCVFEGTVSTIFPISGVNNGIIVRHGNYMTVYTNLVSVSVKPGDKVALNQKLGTLPAGDDKDNHYLHFEIWRINPTGNPTALNPESWLSR